MKGSYFYFYNKYLDKFNYIWNNYLKFKEEKIWKKY